MSSNIDRKLVVLGVALLTISCGGNGMAPSNAGSSDAAPAGTKSILKLLTKDITIGSTVDRTNGDMGPRAVTVVQYNDGKLKKGQLLVCNLEDSAGAAGNGTTIERFNPVANSKPATFVQNSQIEGCDGSAVRVGNTFATGFASDLMVLITREGKLTNTWPITEPLGDGAAPLLNLYAQQYIFIGTETGTIDSYSFGGPGSGEMTEVVNGFDVNKGSGWSALGPSGIAYWCGTLPGMARCPYKNAGDTLYVADGACNAVVEISHASNLLEKDEITIGSGCKKFKCEYPTFTCATLVKAGSPLDKPVAMAILPNGNLIAANTGNNTLVELTPEGQVLDTKVVDKSKTPGIFGVAADGKNDSDTVLFYTDTNTNTLHELKQ